MASSMPKLVVLFPFFFFFKYHAGVLLYLFARDALERQQNHLSFTFLERKSLTLADKSARAP